MTDNNGCSPQLTISEIKEKRYALDYKPTAPDIWTLLAEIDRLNKLLIATQEQKQQVLYIDATPNEEYPLRILEAYRQSATVKWADSTDGSCNNPLYKIMNEHSDRRVEILNDAINAIKRYKSMLDEIDRLNKDLKKYKAFWEQSRLADKMNFELYDYKED